MPTIGLLLDLLISSPAVSRALFECYTVFAGTVITLHLPLAGRLGDNGLLKKPLAWLPQ